VKLHPFGYFLSKGVFLFPKEKEHLKSISGLKRGEELAVGMDRTPTD
jgi:hypothetical protein